MAKVTLNDAEFDKYLNMLSRMGERADETAKRAVYDGANLVANAVKQSAASIPEDVFRYLREGDKFKSAVPLEKTAIVQHMGIASIRQDKDGNWNTKVGFFGYDDAHTAKYPGGHPIAMIARAIESGSSVRKKYPFVKTAVASQKQAAMKAMSATIEAIWQEEFGS